MGLAEIGGPQLIYDRVADGPRMGDVDLLRARCAVVSEAWQKIWGGRLESSERLGVERIVVVKISSKVLFVGQPVIDFHVKFVGVAVLIRRRPKRIKNSAGIGSVRIWNIQL